LLLSISDILGSLALFPRTFLVELFIDIYSFFFFPVLFCHDAPTFTKRLPLVEKSLKCSQALMFDQATNQALVTSSGGWPMAGKEQISPGLAFCSPWHLQAWFHKIQLEGDF